MTTFPKFFYGIAAAFGAPWLFLVILPTIAGEKMEPIPYEKDRDGIDGEYPGAAIYRQGQLTYLQEGCVQCHTQMIRPTFAGVMDGWKKGWGSDQSEQPKRVTRPTTMRDFMGEPVAPLGITRVGPDLANVGYRLKDEASIHQHLYAPKSVHAWSVMPSYRHLYKVQRIEGSGSSKAVKLPKEFAPEKGFEVVPTEAAHQLALYLLSLKKDVPIPGEVPQD